MDDLNVRSLRYQELRTPHLRRVKISKDLTPQSLKNLCNVVINLDLWKQRKIFPKGQEKVWKVMVDLG